MAKNKSETILVPLLPKYDASSIYYSSPLKTSVGKMTVTREDAFPGTIRFDNNVPFKDEAQVESKVFETLSVFLGITSPAGYVVNVEYDRDHPNPIRKGEARGKNDKGFPSGFEAKQLELPILACALKTYGVATDIPAESLCFGELSHRDQNQYIEDFPRSGASGCHLETDGLKLKNMPDRMVAHVFHDDRTIINHLAGLHRLAVFNTDFAEELLGPADRNTVTVQERINHVLDAGSSPDFIRKLKDAGFISEGVPVRYRDAILKKAREVFDADLELWDQRIAPMLEEQFNLDMSWTIGDFYGNPRAAELKRATGPGERAHPSPVRVLPEFKPE